MPASSYAFNQGLDDTRAALRRWNDRPGAVILPWLAGAAVAAAGLLGAVLAVAALSSHGSRIVSLQPPFVGGGLTDAVGILRGNLLVLALHAMACVAGFIAGSSLPLQADEHRGPARAFYEHGGRVAIAFVAAATAFSLTVQALVIGRSLAGFSAFLGVSPGLLLLAVLPHAIPELVALFLPLAAWIIASRRGRWDELLAATLVTVAIALPALGVAALIEVYVSPHVFTALTHVHTPIVRRSEGLVVTVR